jgi:hypothetical protein
LRENLLLSISFLGGIRWLNDTEDLRLNFEGIDFKKFYQGNTLTFDKQACINELHQRSTNKKREITTHKVEQLIAPIKDYYNLCNGHDMTKAIASYLSAHNSKKGVNDCEIGKNLRLAYRKEDFKLTQLYQNLFNWQSQTNLILFAI